MRLLHPSTRGRVVQPPIPGRWPSTITPVVCCCPPRHRPLPFRPPTATGPRLTMTTRRKFMAIMLLLLMQRRLILRAKPAIRRLGPRTRLRIEGAGRGVLSPTVEARAWRLHFHHRRHSRQTTFQTSRHYVSRQESRDKIGDLTAGLSAYHVFMGVSESVAHPLHSHLPRCILVT